MGDFLSVRHCDLPVIIYLNPPSCLFIEMKSNLSFADLILPSLRLDFDLLRRRQLRWVTTTLILFDGRSLNRLDGSELFCFKV